VAYEDHQTAIFYIIFAQIRFPVSKIFSVFICTGLEFTIKAAKELEIIQIRMAQKPMIRADVYARALRASRNVIRAEVLAGLRQKKLGVHQPPKTSILRSTDRQTYRHPIECV
jgi:hypothetical protein